MSIPTPSWRKKSIRRYFVDKFLMAAFNAIPARQTILDLGGHKHSRRGLFDIRSYDHSVFWANISSEKGADLLSDAAAVALSAKSFDIVICSELLEHVPDPRPVLAESFRLLKPGGTLLITVPFLFPIHADPHDYGRYTDQFWLEACDTAGFQAVEVERQGLWYAVMASHLEWYLKRIRPPRPFGRPTYWLLTNLVANPAKGLAVWLEGRDRARRDPDLNRFTTGFGIIARKGEQS